MPKDQAGFAPIFILIALLFLASGGVIGGAIYLKQQQNPLSESQVEKVSAQQPAPIKAIPTQVKTDKVIESTPSTVLKPGLYINPKLNLVFDYPKDWIIYYKKIDQTGNLELHFYLSDIEGKKWYEEDFIIVKAVSGAGEELGKTAQVVHSYSKTKPVRSTIGILEGDFYSEVMSPDPYRYQEDFLAIYTKTSFLFTLGTHSQDKQKFHKLFTDLIGSVRGYDKSEFKLPSGVKDNLELNP